GEVTDQGKIRFVSVNREVLPVNKTGVFVTNIKLIAGMNEVRLKAMDDNNNLVAKVIMIEYNPPVVTLADKINKESTYYGLLIGINDYRDSDLSDLDNPIRDAEKFYRTLTGKYTFDEKNITVLKNPKRTEIIRELDMLRDKITPDDNLLIFYAGHGYYDEESESGYWLPTDAALETTADWFPNSTLVNHLRGIHSKHTLLITDACFAGSIFKTRSVNIPQELIYERIYEQPSRKAMTSGLMTDVPDNSAFIKYLIQRLDENQRTYLSSEELYSSMRNAVISNSHVLPQYGEIQNVGNEGGDFIFLRKE
ncbi:MAG: caspase family protein, partial [Bacteroidales bacterium]|nr:caspase family protein [Bacteroidales bacterium]